MRDDIEERLADALRLDGPYDTRVSEDCLPARVMIAQLTISNDTPERFR